MTVHVYLKPLVGLEHLFQKVGSTSTSQMRKYGGGWGGQGRGGVGHSCWHHGLENHVRAERAWKPEA